MNTENENKEKLRYEVLGNLQYDNFVELLDFLGNKVPKDKSEDERNAIIVTSLDSFFPELTALEEIEFKKIAEDIIYGRENSEREFNKFKIEHSTVKIDRIGTSAISPKKYWEVSLATIEKIYALALSELHKTNFVDHTDNKINIQVFNAKTLAIFENSPLPSSLYLYNKKLFLQTHSDGNVISPKNFFKYEKILKELTGSDTLINYIVEYCKAKTNPRNYMMMVNHI